MVKRANDKSEQHISWKMSFRRFQTENGQTLMEYALIILLIAIIAIVAMTLFGNRLLALFTFFTNQAF